jgi:uncharacterized lipoprotein YmbA
MLSRILISELGQRLPQSIVINETSAVSATRDATIALNVQRMDANASGAVMLEAQASVAFKCRDSALRGFRFTVPPSAPSIQAEVVASSAVGQLADGLATMVTASPGRR